MRFIYEKNNKRFEKSFVQLVDFLGFCSVHKATPRAYGVSLEFYESNDSMNRDEDFYNFYLEAMDLIQNFLGESVTMEKIKLYDMMREYNNLVQFIKHPVKC